MTSGATLAVHQQKDLTPLGKESTGTDTVSSSSGTTFELAFIELKTTHMQHVPATVPVPDVMPCHMLLATWYFVFLDPPRLFRIS
jgi:hypothetical protein